MQIVQMWHLDNGAKCYIYKVLVQMVLTKHFWRLRRADCLVLISSLQQSLWAKFVPIVLGRFINQQKSNQLIAKCSFLLIFFSDQIFGPLVLGCFVNLKRGLFIYVCVCLCVCVCVCDECVWPFMAI